MVLAVSVDIRKSARVAAVVLAAIAGSSLITACQNDPDIDITKLTAETDPPDVLYNQGLANLNAGKTTEAARKFEAIDKQHPFSEYARKALVMNAFVAYRNGQYQDAINSTNRYLNLYPQSEDAAYAQYIQGLAYTKQIPSVTQDQRPAAKAIEAMQVVVDKYPDLNMSTMRRQRSALHATSSPARRCRSAAIISSAKNIWQRFRASAPSSSGIRPPIRSRKRSPASSKPIMRWA